MFWSLLLLVPVTLVLVVCVCHIIYESRKKPFAGILWIKSKPFCPACKQSLAIVKNPEKPRHSSDFYCKKCDIHPKTYSKNGIYMPAILAMQARGEIGFNYSLQEELTRIEEETKTNEQRFQELRTLPLKGNIRWGKDGEAFCKYCASTVPMDFCNDPEISISQISFKCNSCNKINRPQGPDLRYINAREAALNMGAKNGMDLTDLHEKLYGIPSNTSKS